MRPGEREACRRVIKGGARPRRCVVALFAGLWEARTYVIRIGSALEIGQVAADARGRRQVVVIVDVALGTLQRGVCAGQREARVVVVERCLRPRSRVVALLAGLGEARRHVIRIRRALKILQVAVHAVRISTGQGVVVVDVALRALECSVRAGEREAGRRVIKSRVRPRRRVMALSACL